MSNGNRHLRDHTPPGVYDEISLKRRGRVLGRLVPGDVLALVNDLGLAAYNAGLHANADDPEEKFQAGNRYYDAYLACQQLLMGATRGTRPEVDIGLAGNRSPMQRRVS